MKNKSREPSYISEWVRLAKEENCKESKQKLLDEYYQDGYRWVKSLMTSIIYTDLIKPSEGEIASIIYLSFEKAIRNIRCGEGGLMSFKNFFFLMIKWQLYADLKSTLNYRVVRKYSDNVDTLKKEIEESSEKDQIRNANIKDLFQRILAFLDTKNPEYSKIFVLKAQGYKNSEICKKLALSEISLKSRIQYSKKLIRENFGDFSDNF